MQWGFLFDEINNDNYVYNFLIPFSSKNYILTTSWLNYVSSNNYVGLKERNNTNCVLSCSFVVNVCFCFRGF